MLTSWAYFDAQIDVCVQPGALLGGDGQTKKLCFRSSAR